MSHRKDLRSATRDAHQRLDGVLSGMDLFASNLGYRSYLTVMQALHAYCRDSVSRIENAIGLPGSVDELESSLHSDLISTGLNELEKQTPEPPSGPPSKHADWGRAYVVEGSAMGGRYLAKLAAEQLPNGNSHAYLDQLAKNAEQRWPVFVAKLDGVKDLDIEAAVTAAEDVFGFTERFALNHFESSQS